MEQKNTVAIVGSHPNGKKFDFDRTDCDVWVFNEALKTDWIKRADGVFQMHVRPIWENPKNRNDPNHGAWLKSGDTPIIYMQEHFADVPRCERYPLDEIAEVLLQNTNVEKYFTSSAAYAIALAIYKGYQKIEVYGVEMETDTEYRYQREGVALWAGIAIGRGITFEYHGGMFDAPLYGYTAEVDIKYQAFIDRIAALQPFVEKAANEYNAAKEAADKALLHYHDSGSGLPELSEAIKAQVSAGYNFGIMDGARQENERYKAKADTMQAESGAFVFSRQEFEQAAQNIGKQRAQFQQEAAAHAGSAQQILNDAEKVKNMIKRRKMLQRQFAPKLAEYVRASIYTGLATGAHRENLEYLGKLDEMIKASGGRKSEEVLLAQ